MITIKTSIFYCFHPNYAKYFILSVRYCTKNVVFILYMSSSKLYPILKYFAQLFRFKSITSSKDNFVWIDIPLWKMSRQNITASLINLYHEIFQYEMYPSRIFFFPFFQRQIISGRKLFQSPKHFSVKYSSRNYRKWSKKKKKKKSRRYDDTHKSSNKAVAVNHCVNKIAASVMNIDARLS